MHTIHNKHQLIARVRRIAGQVAAIEKALNDEVPCNDVLHQVAGVRGAVAGLMDELIDGHVRDHVAHPDLSADERQQGAQELMDLIRRYGK